VRYTGRGNHSHDVGAVRTDWPCPRRCHVYYYEVTIEDSGNRGSIAVGLADATFQLHRQPGWEPNSYAYGGHDGRRYSDSERGEPFGPSFGAGDIVGCGLLQATREIFFTKNGVHLGVAFSAATIGLYPTIGLHSPNERVRVNLGGSLFAFDIEAFVRSQRCCQLSAVAGTQLPALSIDSLVRSYLLHFGYEQTLAGLDVNDMAMAAGMRASADAEPPMEASVRDEASAPKSSPSHSSSHSTSPAPAPAPASNTGAVKTCSRDSGSFALNTALPNCTAADFDDANPTASQPCFSHRTTEAAVRATLAQRREVARRVMAGDMAGAMRVMEEHQPGLLAMHEDLRFRLRCQAFVEHVRASDAMAAVQYAREELHGYQAAGGERARELEALFSLLAYSDPATAEGPASRFLATEYLQGTADMINGIILSAHGAPSTCGLEKLLRQLVASSDVLREVNAGFGDRLRIAPNNLPLPAATPAMPAAVPSPPNGTSSAEGVMSPVAPIS